MSKRYFYKNLSENGKKVADIYLEYTDGQNTRQIQLYQDGKEYFSDSQEDVYPDIGASGLSDIPLRESLEAGDFTDSDEISVEKFESVWKTQENNPRVIPKAKRG